MVGFLYFLSLIFAFIGSVQLGRAFLHHVEARFANKVLKKNHFLFLTAMMALPLIAYGFMATGSKFSIFPETLLLLFFLLLFVFSYKIYLDSDLITVIQGFVTFMVLAVVILLTENWFLIFILSR